MHDWIVFKLDSSNEYLFHTLCPPYSITRNNLTHECGIPHVGAPALGRGICENRELCLKRS